MIYVLFPAPIFVCPHVFFESILRHLHLAHLLAQACLCARKARGGTSFISQRSPKLLRDNESFQWPQQTIQRFLHQGLTVQGNAPKLTSDHGIFKIGKQTETWHRLRVFRHFKGDGQMQVPTGSKVVLANLMDSPRGGFHLVAGQKHGKKALGPRLRIRTCST